MFCYLYFLDAHLAANTITVIIIFLAYTTQYLWIILHLRSFRSRIEFLEIELLCHKIIPSFLLWRLLSCILHLIWWILVVIFSIFRIIFCMLRCFFNLIMQLLLSHWFLLLPKKWLKWRRYLDFTNRFWNMIVPRFSFRCMLVRTTILIHLRGDIRRLLKPIVLLVFKVSDCLIVFRYFKGIVDFQIDVRLFLDERLGFFHWQKKTIWT